MNTYHPRLVRCIKCFHICILILAVQIFQLFLPQSLQAQEIQPVGPPTTQTPFVWHGLGSSIPALPSGNSTGLRLPPDIDDGDIEGGGGTGIGRVVSVIDFAGGIIFFAIVYALIGRRRLKVKS